MRFHNPVFDQVPSICCPETPSPLLLSGACGQQACHSGTIISPPVASAVASTSTNIASSTLRKHDAGLTAFAACDLALVRMTCKRHHLCNHIGITSLPSQRLPQPVGAQHLHNRFCFLKNRCRWQQHVRYEILVCMHIHTHIAL